MKAAILRTVLCSAQASSVAACRLSTAGKRGSSLLYCTRHWRVCVCVFGSSTCVRKCVCVFACGYSWVLMTTLGNSSWHQLHSIALLHQIASTSMTKRSPLQIFQNHVVITVPFISRKGTSSELHLASQDGFSGCCLNQKFQDSYCNDSDYLSDHMNFNWSFSKPLLWHAFNKSVWSIASALCVISWSPCETLQNESYLWYSNGHSLYRRLICKTNPLDHTFWFCCHWTNYHL